MTTEARPAALTALAASRVVLLDFDGPVCSIFAGRAAPLIAHELADLLAATAPRFHGRSSTRATLSP